MEGAMDILRKHLNKVRIPSRSNKVYKEECCVSFDTTVSTVQHSTCKLIASILMPC